MQWIVASLFSKRLKNEEEIQKYFLSNIWVALLVRTYPFVKTASASQQTSQHEPNSKKRKKEVERNADDAFTYWKFQHHVTDYYSLPPICRRPVWFCWPELRFSVSHYVLFSFFLSQWTHTTQKWAHLRAQRIRNLTHGLLQPTSRLSSSESRQRDSWMLAEGREPLSSSSPLPLKLSRLAADGAFVVQKHAAFHGDGLSRRAWGSCGWMTPEWEETNGSWSPAATAHIWAPAERLRHIHLQTAASPPPFPPRKWWCAPRVQVLLWHVALTGLFSTR